MNPIAINMWITGASFGYFFNGSHGAALGLAITSGLSFLMSFIQK